MYFGWRGKVAGLRGSAAKQWVPASTRVDMSESLDLKIMFPWVWSR
jgi:hypothetical protein